MLKKRLEILISLVLFSYDSITNLLHSVLGKTSPSVCVILYYHSIKSGDRPRFARQLDVLLKRTRPIRADQQIVPSHGSHYVSITIDDGFVCAFENAVPELVKRKIPFAIFVPSGLIGETACWLKGARAGTEIVMRAEQLLRLKKEKLALIGSHCITHRNLRELDEEESKNEIFGSKKALEHLLNIEINLLSFPYGAYAKPHIRYAKEAGYQRVFSTSPTTAFRVQNEFLTGRVSVEPTDSLLEFNLKIRGAYRWLPLAIHLKQKLRSLMKWMSI